MKHVIKFDGFVNEAKTTAEVKTQITTTKNIKINKKIADQVILAEELSSKIEKLTKEFKEKVEPLAQTLNKYNEELIETFQTLGINQAKIEDVIVTMKEGKGSITYSYKEMYAEALKKVNEQTKLVLLKIQEANKHVNAGKIKIEYEKANEGLKDVWKGIVDWFKGVWKDIKKSIMGQTNAVKDLEKLAEKAKASAVTESKELNEKKNPDVLKPTEPQGIEVVVEQVGDFVYLKQDNQQIVLDQQQCRDFGLFANGIA